MQTGFFGIIGLRKLIFGFTLVFLNNFPGLNLAIFLILNLAIIFIIIYYKPYKNLLIMIHDVISELAFLIIFTSSFVLLKETND